MIIEHDGKKYLEMPFEVGEEVYICTTTDWNLGIVKGVVSDMEAYYWDKAKDYYWRIYVDHDHIHSENNPVLIVNRYIFVEEELAKTIEEAKQKIYNKAIQLEGRRKVNRGVNVEEMS